MPRDRDESKLRPDANDIAFRTVQAALGDAPKPRPPGDGEKNPEAVRRGQKGGKKGGNARAESLSERKRKQIAKKAAVARWQEPPCES